MKLQRTSLVLLLSAALLAGGVALYETQKKSPLARSDVDQTMSQKVFDFEEAAIAFLTIETSALTASTPVPSATPGATPSPSPASPDKVTAVSVKKIDGKWQLSAPLKVMADESTVLFLTNLLTTAQRDRTLDVSRDRVAEFGFDQPLATITITLADQTKHKLVLGKLSFDRTFIYAQIDPNPEAEKLSVSLVSPQFANAVNRQLKEWQGKEQVPQPNVPPAASPVEPAASPQPEPSSAPAESSESSKPESGKSESSKPESGKSESGKSEKPSKSPVETSSERPDPQASPSPAPSPSPKDNKAGPPTPSSTPKKPESPAAKSPPPKSDVKPAPDNSAPSSKP